MTYLFILLINYMSGIGLHAFHVSVCEVEYDEQQKQLEITHRIFLDDLEVGLSNWSGKKIDVLNPDDPDMLIGLIGKYLSAKTSYTLNNKLTPCTFIGAEKEDGVMYCYQVITNVKKVKSLKIENTVLFEIFEDQSNIIHVDSSGTTKSLKLNGGESSGEVFFDIK